MIAVSDSSPLIYLAGIKKISLLQDFFREVLISKAVYDEVVIQGRKRKGANDVKKAEWIKVKAIEDERGVEFLRYFLNLGEAEAIILAKEVKADVLLVDDLAARILARGQGIKIMGTLGLLEKAHHSGKIEDLKSAVDELKREGFWMSKELYEEMIRRKS